MIANPTQHPCKQRLPCGLSGGFVERDLSSSTTAVDELYHPFVEDTSYTERETADVVCSSPGRFCLLRRLNVSVRSKQVLWIPFRLESGKPTQSLPKCCLDAFAIFVFRQEVDIRAAGGE